MDTTFIFYEMRSRTLGNCPSQPSFQLVCAMFFLFFCTVPAWWGGGRSGITKRFVWFHSHRIHVWYIIPYMGPMGFFSLHFPGAFLEHDFRENLCQVQGCHHHRRYAKQLTETGAVTSAIVGDGRATGWNTFG